jgi:hypothetical protein
MGDLGSLMTAGGIQDAIPRLPGGKALMRSARKGTKSKVKGPKNKRKKQNRKRRR